MGNCVGNQSRRRNLRSDNENLQGQQTNSLAVVTSTVPVHNPVNIPNYPNNPNEANQISIDATIYKSSVTLQPDPENTDKYILDFEFSSKVNCKITVYYFAKDVYDPALNSNYYYIDPDKYPSPQTFTFESGDKQHFKNLCLIDVKKYTEDELSFKDKKTFPLIIEITPFTNLNSYALTSYFKITNSSGHCLLSCIRQKIVVNGIPHELKDLFCYKSEGNECSICLTEKKEMVVIPCHHACLCQGCAEHLKTENRINCPICRGPIRQILKLNEAN